MVVVLHKAFFLPLGPTKDSKHEDFWLTKKEAKPEGQLYTKSLYTVQHMHMHTLYVQCIHVHMCKNNK